jgi:hypothetical protein
MITRIPKWRETNRPLARRPRGAGRPIFIQLINLAVLLLLLGVLVVVLKDRRRVEVKAPAPPARPRTLAPPVVRPTTAPSLKELGRHQAVVFSPDFAAKGNRVFYERLGFQYWETASWEEVLAGVAAYNRAHPERRIKEVFAETHGSNGNGLKLQDSYAPEARRSYVSLGGLQERLGGLGVERVVLSGCNTGRLSRPEIYYRLDLTVKDKTVLPATLGVINASPGFDPEQSPVEFVRRRESRIEQTSEGHFRELPPAARRELRLPASAEVFVVSNLFMQMLLGDRRLELANTGYVRELSRATEDERTSEAIFQNFLKLLRRLAERKTAAPALAQKERQLSAAGGQ